MNELALFAGAGGGILGGKLLGWDTICAVERDEYCASILVQRQNDGILEPFPIWSDVRTFDGKPWKGRVDIISGGFPCQDISSAGAGAGIEGEKSGLWVEMARIVSEVRPTFVFVENSPILTSRGLHRVLGDLSELGYDAEWGIVGAHHAGAPHKRNRIWVIACNSYSQSESIESFYEKTPRLQKLDANTNKVGLRVSRKVAEQTRVGQSTNLGPGDTNSTKKRLERHRTDSRKQEVNQPWDMGDTVSNSDKGRHWIRKEKIQPRRDSSVACDWWKTEPELGRVAHGVASRVDRLKAIGNGQVPKVAAIAWEVLSND
jgi:DNA (cytosine-5)-methyltransferase 1